MKRAALALFALLAMLMAVAAFTLTCSSSGDDDDDDEPTVCESAYNITKEMYDCVLAAIESEDYSDIDTGGECSNSFYADIESLGGCFADFSEDGSVWAGCYVDTCGEELGGCANDCRTYLSNCNSLEICIQSFQTAAACFDECMGSESD